jgi:hypothetical protein
MSTHEGMAPPPDRRALGWVIIALALLATAVGVNDYFAQKSALATYQPANATITGVTVESRSGRRGRTWYTPVVRYAYEINGKHYEGSRLRRGKGPSYRDPREAARVAALYKQGHSVSVYINPADPSQSFVLHQTWAQVARPPAAMLALLGFNYWVLVARHRRRKTARAAHLRRAA